MAQILLKNENGINTDVIDIDVTEQEDTNFEASITEYPLETGATISDHLVRKPVKVKLTGIVSDTPIAFLGISERNRSLTAHQAMSDLHKSDDLVTVVTDVDVYESMRLVRYNVVADKDTGRALNFSAEFQEVLKAESKIITIPADSAQLATPTQNGGKQVTTETSPGGAAKSSILNNLFGG